MPITVSMVSADMPSVNVLILADMISIRPSVGDDIPDAMGGRATASERAPQEYATRIFRRTPLVRFFRQ